MNAWPSWSRACATYPAPRAASRANMEHTEEVYTSFVDVAAKQASHALCDDEEETPRGWIARPTPTTKERT
jgi:hypothetical protein